MFRKERKKTIFVLFVGFILLAGLPLWAQEEYPKAEVFGGYSYLNTDRIFSQRENGHGWGASVSGNFHKYFGATADFGGHYGHVTLPVGFGTTLSPSASTHEFLFGPRFTARGKRVTGFAHALFGVAYTRISSSPGPFPSSGRFSSTNFAMGFGGGLDINVGKHFAIRTAQVDYIPVHLSPGWLHNVRIQTGVVFKFGS